jgi:hypothetical protein
MDVLECVACCVLRGVMREMSLRDVLRACEVCCAGLRECVVVV